MGISLSDLKRAISAGGEVTTFASIYHQALDNPPVQSLTRLDLPSKISDSLVLASYIDPGIPSVFTCTTTDSAEIQLSWEKTDLILAGIPHYGNYIGRYIENLIDQVNPDIVAVDSSPVEMGVDIQYAFSLPCAAGLPFHAEVVRKDNGDVYTSRKLYPGNAYETTIIKAWLKKIPVLPAGYPPRPVELVFVPFQGDSDLNYAEKTKWEASLFKAYRSLDKELEKVSDPQAGNAAAREVNLSLLDSQGDEKREELGIESGYLVSRLLDIAGQAKHRKGRIRLLALADVAHLADIEYYLTLLKKGKASDIYTPVKKDIQIADVTMTSNTRDNLSGTVGEYTPESTLAQKIFFNAFAIFIQECDNEILRTDKAHGLITAIVNRTRNHPEVKRGISVRGTIAFEEIARAMADIHGGLKRESIEKAALIALPPRLYLKQKGGEAAFIRDITQEVLYGFEYSGQPGELEFNRLKGLSAQDILEKLSDLDRLKADQKMEKRHMKSPAVVAEGHKNREMLKYLEKMEYVKKDEQNQYQLTRKALEFLMRDLEEKLKSGEISPAEYSQQKSILMQKLKNISEPQFQMSNGEIANTIMEMIDAQDKQWNSEVNFDTMHVYYHIKENSEGSDLSPHKRDYYALRRLIDELERRKVLMTAARSQGFLLTGLALDILLKHLINQDLKNRPVQSKTGLGKTWSNERNHEIRRYCQGDAFRDISVRHTLKQVVKQKKGLYDIRNSDIRVFMKQTHQPPSDIILCLDTSGSMGFHQKLMFARLAAAGLVQAGLQQGNRMGIVAFSDQGQVTVPLTATDKNLLLNCIAALSARGNTNIGDGIKSSSELLFRSNNQNQKHIILISDGQPTAVSEGAFSRLKEMKEKDLTEESALMETRQAAARGIQLSVIHIAAQGEPSDSFIKSIAIVGKGKIKRIGGPEDLREMLKA